MPALLEFQNRFRDALIAGGDAAAAGLIRDDGMPAEARIDVYRNNVFVSLKRVLLDGFPVVCRLVDERFFLYATDEFIRAHPPEQACLFAYGERFADFLAQFEPCRALVYLPDVARFEWLMHVAAFAAEATPILSSALASVAEADTPHLVLTLEPSLGYLRSAWPIDQIWRANRPGADTEATIDLHAGGVTIEVRRVAEDVVFRSLDEATYSFRSRLAEGSRLEAAADAVLAIDPSFDLQAALARLFAEGAIVGFSVSVRT
jgi:hypothetical protein